MNKHLEYFSPHITVATVVQAENRFLMVEEWINDRATLNQPAGHLEANETILEAAARELFEETGLKFTPTALLKMYQWTSPDGISFLRFTFVLNLESCVAAIPQDKDIQACHWLTLEEIIAWKNLRSPLVIESLQCYQQQQYYPVSLLKFLHH